ncbi:capsid cement protein [Kineosporia sp. NBRC 101731]|uniref:capsid cement protein n=1 Tax=Kineosporia sp. NBRC 101731 TaxID=3032199 RepID=UPI0024A2A889|nr:capsid cement protein [Kineosporia sp. NBRC 101731]GLY32123.1 hypothetical protein Kisp02_54880 [Kineosporia sp. NBRC 101731]
MADYVATYLPGQEITQTATATITGGQVLINSGEGSVAPSAGASNKVVFVACHDGITGQAVTVTRGGVQRLTASAAIAAGVKVKSAAAGQVAAWVSGTDNPDLIIGTSLTSAAAANATLDVNWSL